MGKRLRPAPRRLPSLLVGASLGLLLVAQTPGLSALGPSTRSPAAVPRALAVPGAPTGVSVVAGNTQATVSWTAPASNGGSAITRYTATASPGGKSCSTADGATLSCTVTGLTNGSGYTFTVTATNAVGTSSPSAKSATAVPGPSAPSAPRGVTAQAADGQLSVSWTAPASDGGSAIIAYTATASPGGKSCTTLDGVTLSCTITGLSNGTAYAIAVTAINAMGTSPAGSPPGPATPGGPPGAPTSVTGVKGNGQVVVSWIPPTSNGGAAILSYKATASDGSSCTYVVSSPETDTCTVTGLVNGTAYTFTVTATNAVGTSPASARSKAVTPSAVAPDAPTNPSALRGPAQATVSWTAPASNGGAAISSYSATASPGGKSCSTPDGLTLSCTVTGLSNGTAYTFTVTAKNAAGTSLPSLPTSPVTPATTPGPPTSVTAVKGNGQATVSWVPPVFNGGTAITAYTATASDGSSCSYVVASPETDTCTITGLTNGTAYTFTVTATNAVGVGAASAKSKSVTPMPVAPDAPTKVVGLPGNTQATVSWTSPASNGGQPITTYTATASPGGKTCTTPNGASLSCTISGLVNGNAYTFTVTAKNSVGSSPASDASSPVVPVATPGAPTAVSAIAANARATVSWLAPSSDGSSPITSYTATASPGGKSCTTPDGATLSCTVTGLSNGTPYTFTVTATNAVGVGAASSPSNPVTPNPVAPSAPASPTASWDNAQVTVSWTASASDGGAAIASYTATASPGGRSCTTPDGSTLSCTITGLTNGTAYTFTVTATNPAGTSLPSSPTSPVTPATTPGAPTNPSAVAGNARATVSWLTPAANGGAAITAYTATASPGGKSCTTPDGSTLSCTVTGLANGIAYTFTVTARNVAGTSSPSAASGPATPATTPDAPANPTATASNAQATVSWTAPASDGGAAIASYTATASPGGKSCTTPDGSTLSCTITGLTNGTAYTFTVTASNAVGVGTASARSKAVTPSPVAPSAPAGVLGVSGNGQVVVSWTAPASDGGAAIASYTATASPGGQACTTANGSTLSCTITGLTNGTAYTFTVTARNLAGSSLPSASSLPVNPATTPGPPTSATAVKGNGRATVSWVPPSTDGGAPITSYKVTASDGSSCTYVVATPETDTCTVTGLVNGTAYTFTVVATNAVGSSTASAKTKSVTPQPVLPDAPSGVTAVPGNAQVSVSWLAPASNGGATITAYTATASPGGKSCTTPDGSTLSCAVTGLNNGSTYTFTVTAKNSVGTSPASTASAPATPATLPGAPSTPAVAKGNMQVTVSWSAPGNDGGSPITSYTATASPGGKSCTTPDGATLSCTVTGLTNGTAYSFTVTATNAVGTSPASAKSKNVTPKQVAPDAPTRPTAVAGNAQATVSWSAPPNDGGSPITSYTATASPGGQACTTPDGTTLSCTVTGLVNGTAYSFTVTATNAVGSSPASPPSDAATPASAPAAPSTVVAQRGNTQATVSWTAPANDGGSPITAYTATASPGGQRCSVTASATLSCTVTGLTNGTAYSFTVTATNAIGTGPSSSPSAAVTPATPPGAPQQASLAAGFGRVTVSWNAPLSTGGLPVSSYSATASPGGKSCSADGSSFSCTITGLTNGTSYAVVVVATTTAGDSPAAPAGQVTPGLCNGRVVTAGANLFGANLSGCDLSGVDLSGANLSGANLAGSTLDGVRSGGLRGIPAALPSGWVVFAGYLMGPGANLDGANLAGRNLLGLDLEAASLRGANLRSAVVSCTAALCTDLSGADLTGADLTASLWAGNSASLPVSPSLVGATLSGANLSRAQLSLQNLYGVRAVGLVGSPAALPSSYQLLKGTLLGPGVDLSGLSFSGANLSGMNLSGAKLQGSKLDGANLAGTDLSYGDLTAANLAGAALAGANLNGVVSSGITGVPASLPTGWSILGGVLVGP